MAQKLVHAAGHGEPRSSGHASAQVGPSREEATVSYGWQVPVQRRCRSGPARAENNGRKNRNGMQHKVLDSKGNKWLLQIIMRIKAI